MTVFDTIAGFFGSQEASDAQADAIRKALAQSRDVVSTTRSDLSPYLNLGANSANALNQVFFGQPASPGTRSGATPPVDFDRLEGTLTDFKPRNRKDRKRINNALRRIRGFERALDRDTSGFTNRDQRQFESELAKRERRLTTNLENLGLDPSTFAFSGGTPASAPTLDPFFASPEFQLFADQNARVVQDTLAALSQAGLADSGLGREVVTNTVSRSLGDAFNSFVNRNLTLGNSGQTAARTAADTATRTNTVDARLFQDLGAARGAGQYNAFAALGDLGNQTAQAITAGFQAPGSGFSFGAAGNSLTGGKIFG